MSLYVFGKFVTTKDDLSLCKQELLALSAKLNLHVVVDSIEDEDAEIVDDAVNDPDNDGFYYSVFSNREDHDATVLWVEAIELAHKQFRQAGIDPLSITPASIDEMHFPSEYFQEIVKSRLGAFIDRLELLASNRTLAIALVDGGVERVLQAPFEVCGKEILRSLVLPWDRISNTLYVAAPTRIN